MKRLYGQHRVSNGAKIVAALLVLSGPALADGDIFGAPSTASPLQQSVVNGDCYGAGLVACIAGGIGDSDTTAPAANTYLLNLHWKRSN